MRHRNDRFQKKKKSQGSEGFTKIPSTLIHCGNFLSPKAFRIYCIIISFEPSFPGYRKLRSSSGYAFEAIRNAIEECVEKGLLEYESGQKRRKSNQYRPRPQSEWNLLAQVASPSEKHKAARIRRAKPVPARLSRKCFDNRKLAASIIENEGVSILEEELDQSQIDQFNHRGAPRYQPKKSAGGDGGTGKRSPLGQDHTPGKKGVGLTADQRSEIDALYSKWTAEEKMAREKKVGTGEMCKTHANP
jgi:hypothetical protein